MNITITPAIFLVFLGAFGVHTASLAAPNEVKVDSKNGIKLVSIDDARCKKDVTQYAETLQFVRQSAGEQVSAKVMSSYVPIDQLNQVVGTAGYCAGAQLLRDKKALR